MWLKTGFLEDYSNLAVQVTDAEEQQKGYLPTVTRGTVEDR